MRHVAFGWAVGGIMLAMLAGPPAASEEAVRHVVDVSKGMIPIWSPDGEQLEPVTRDSFKKGLPIEIKEERNGYYLIEHPDEGPVFVPAYAVELDGSGFEPKPVPCDALGSFASRSTSGLGAGESCR